MYSCFNPGQPWLDSEGKRIHAHGGSVLYVDGVFYWYGENKEKSFCEYDLWHWGVKLYSSTDLYNWKDEGIIMPPQPDEPGHPLHPNSMMDRPHILYNEKTGKYVMWMKVMESGSAQYMIIAVSDTIKGPFVLVNKKLHPGGMNAGDFDLVKFEDGSAVIVFEKVHSEMIVMDLTDDYLDVTDHYTSHYPRPCPPHVREAPAVFFRNGKGYVITSGTTGKMPNPSETATFTDIHGQWTILGDPHVDDPKKTSFDSQISCVFKHPQHDLYIAVADRWLNDLADDGPTGIEFFAAKMDPDYPMDPQRREEIRKLHMRDITQKNTAMADYVWLPIKFENDVPKIYWHDHWTIEDAMKQN